MSGLLYLPQNGRLLLTRLFPSSHQLRQLQKPCAEAAFVQRKPLRAGLRDAAGFTMQRIKDYVWSEDIATLFRKRTSALSNQDNVFTHGDLARSI